MGVRTHLGLQVWVSRPLTGGMHRPWALSLCAWAAGLLIMVLAHLWFQVWAPMPLI